MYRLLSILLALTVVGCGPDKQQQVRGAGSFGDPIVVGVAWPFSSRSDQFRKGVTMAADDLNDQGGVLGRPLKLVFSDDGGNAGMGKLVAQQFAEHTEMVAVLGHYDTHIAERASLTYQYSGLLMMTPAATQPNLTQQGLSRIFRTIPNDTQIGGQLAEMAKRHGYQRIVIVLEQSKYGRNLANAIEFRCEDLGITTVDRLSYDSGVEDYRLILSRLQLLKCDAIFFAGLGKDASAIIAAARAQGFQQPVLGGNGLDTPDLFAAGAEAVEGTYLLSVFDSQNPNPYVQNFNRRFSAIHQSLPDAWAAQGYDIVQLLAHGIRSAQSTDPDAIARGLHGLEEWYGVTGRHDFDEKGEVQHKPMVMKVARNGKLAFTDN